MRFKELRNKLSGGIFLSAMMGITDSKYCAERGQGCAMTQIGAYLAEPSEYGTERWFLPSNPAARAREVFDLGADVSTNVFVEKVRELKPDILGLSALMTTTMTVQREVIAALSEAQLRKDVKVMLGGAPVTEEWVNEIGADSFGLDADSAVSEDLRLMEEARVDA